MSSESFSLSCMRISIDCLRETSFHKRGSPILDRTDRLLLCPAGNVHALTLCSMNRHKSPCATMGAFGNNRPRQQGSAGVAGADEAGKRWTTPLWHRVLDKLA